VTEANSLVGDAVSILSAPSPHSSAMYFAQTRPLNRSWIALIRRNDASDGRQIGTDSRRDLSLALWAITEGTRSASVALVGPAHYRGSDAKQLD
jgi:hypothetical protein